MLCLTFADALSKFRSIQPDRNKLKIDVKEQHIELTFGKNAIKINDVDSIGSLFYKADVDLACTKILKAFQ